MTAQIFNKFFKASGMLKIVTFIVPVLILTVGVSMADGESNKMVSVQLEKVDSGQLLRIVTDKPVGYRYTVYDSIDPVRVVIDFPGMDVTDIPALTDTLQDPVSRVDVSSYDLTSGRLGRVEVILDQLSDYDVVINGNEFLLTLVPKSLKGSSVPVAATSKSGEAVPVSQLPADDKEKSTAEVVSTESVPAKFEKTAMKITDVSVSTQSVSLQADGHVEIYKFFTLTGPSRLVVDVYGVKPGFKERMFKLDDSFSRARVGIYKDKVRFVFDAIGKIPDYAVTNDNNDVLVTWGAGAAAAESVVSNQISPVPSDAPVSVENVDFSVEDGVSVLRVKLSGQPQIIDPTQKDGIIGFGVRNATISRSLRRAIDASSFPSAIRIVTPYTVQVGSKQDVRFAVELKGATTYNVEQSGNEVVLKVVNGPFAEPRPVSPEQIAVALPEQGGAVPSIVEDGAVVPAREDGSTMSLASGVSEPVNADTIDSNAQFDAQNEQLIGQAASPQYTGQRISLVFDNADIRNILQLIAEVSELNILAGDGVEGTITLRLIDVPWDQALDLILETKDLGMVRQGNVARILPREAIRTMEESKFTAARTKEKLEDLVTEVIKVSYTDLKNVSGPVKGLMTDRGKLTEDARNKQLILSDIPKVIESAKDLAKILDTPERQVLIEARIVEVQSTANLDLGVNWDLYHSQNPSADPNMEGEIGLGGNFVIPPFAAGTSQAAGIGTAFSWGQVGVDTTILDLRLSAVETAGHGRVVSNPRILTLNGESAKISQGTMIPYQTVSNSEIKTELVEAALSLDVTPVINPDGSVILTVKAANSTPGTTVATGAGAAPSIDKKEAQTKMLINDGDTMVIGGIYIEKDDFSENGVPILMHMPLIGNLFKSTKNNKNRVELMIFITPRIVD